MRVRRDYGDKNCIGRNLEGQRREASDREVLALSQIFQVPMERLFQPPEE